MALQLRVQTLVLPQQLSDVGNVKLSTHVRTSRSDFSISPCQSKLSKHRGVNLNDGPFHWGRSGSRAYFCGEKKPRKQLRHKAVTATGGGGTTDGPGGVGGGGGGGEGHSGGNDSGKGPGGLLGVFLKGWKERVDADPQFVFKVMTEQLIGVTACMIGDMASRPNWGLNELDFVFSTLVVGSILNFSLMYMLAPTLAGNSALPGIFASSPAGHMFESGAFSIVQRGGTLLYKGTQFAAVGFAAGIVGTAASTLLLKVRKSLQPDFQLQNLPPPPLLNATAWALHMGISSNIRYQALNGLEGILVASLNPAMFKALVMALRMGNNVLGGFSFVTLARLTGSQKASKKEVSIDAQELGASDH